MTLKTIKNTPLSSSFHPQLSSITQNSDFERCIASANELEFSKWDILCLSCITFNLGYYNMIRIKPMQLILLILASCFSLSAYAENHWPMAELLTHPLNETLRTEVPSSMAEFSGVAVKTAAKNDGYPHVLLPADWNDGRLCFEVRSRNGLYYAENEYQISIKPKEATFIALPYESHDLDNSHRIADDAAPLAYSGSCKRSVTQSFKPLPAIWGTPGNAVVGDVVIYTNLGRDGEVTAVMNTPSALVPGQCKYLTGISTAYDWKCSFNFAGKNVQTGEAVITQDFDIERNNHRITVDLGD
jgi:hypothetical protein